MTKAQVKRKKTERICCTRKVELCVKEKKIMKKVWVLEPNAPMAVGSLVQSEARFRSVDFPQKEQLGSCREIRNAQGQALSGSSEDVIHVHSTHMYSDMGAVETAGAGGCRLFWLPMLLL